MTGPINGPDSYRDDRMYVMRLTSDFEVDDDGLVTASMRRDQQLAEDKPVLLITYRNTHSLPAVRTDQFPTLREALEYVKAIEPTCPRLSFGGRAPDPAIGWEEHLQWLHANGLSSAAEGGEPIPEWVDDERNPKEQFLSRKASNR